MPVMTYSNAGAATTTPGSSDTYDLGSAALEWRRFFLGDQTDALQFGIAQDIALGRVAANILGLASGDSFRIASDGQLQISSDVALLRGAADRLDLASGDTLRLLAGILDLGSDVQLSRSAANVLALAAGDRLDLLGGLLNLGDAAADPTAAGEVRRNSADVKVYSNGAVRNLSDVHAEAHGVGQHTDVAREFFVPRPTRHTGSEQPHGQHGAIRAVDLATTLLSYEFRLPDDYVSGLTVEACFYSGASALNMYWKWGIDIGADGEAHNTHILTTGFATVTVGGTNILDVEGHSDAPDFAGTVAAGDYIGVNIERDGAHASDTIGGDINFIGLRVSYTGHQ